MEQNIFFLGRIVLILFFAISGYCTVTAESFKQPSEADLSLSSSMAWGKSDAIDDVAPIRTFFTGLQKVLKWNPVSGRYIRIAGKWDFTAERGEHANGNFELLKGAGEYFRIVFSGKGLPVQLLDNGLAVGDNGRVWFTTADGGYFIASSPGNGISSRINPGVALRRRLLEGLAGMIALSGDLGMLKSIARLSSKYSTDGLTLTAMYKNMQIEFLISRDGAKLRVINITTPGWGVVKIMFTSWEPDSSGDKELFSPPKGVARREVPEEEIKAVAASAVNAIFTIAGIK